MPSVYHWLSVVSRATDAAAAAAAGARTDGRQAAAGGVLPRIG